MIILNRGLGIRNVYTYIKYGVGYLGGCDYYLGVPIQCSAIIQELEFARSCNVNRVLELALKRAKARIRPTSLHTH